MNERELKCIGQRVATNIDNHQDARTLYREVRILRDTLRQLRHGVHDVHDLALISDALGGDIDAE